MGDDVKAGVRAAVRLASGDALEVVVASGDPMAWLALDTGVREPDWYRSGFRPRWTYTAPLPAELDEGRLALALCHHDGRIREKAVLRAAGYPRLLPLVVIRCADWAAPVRERARAVLRELLAPDTAVALAPLILLVGRRGRGDFAAGLLDEVLRQVPHPVLTELYKSTDRTVRRFAFTLAARQGLLSPAELARAAARDTDAVVQSLCADAALTAAADDGAYDDVLEPLLSARSPRARAAGVTALRRAGRPERAEGFLGDRSGLVRACARYVVRQYGGDPLPWYRERCATPEGPAPGAVSGLAECGRREDAELLWPLLEHPVAAVRARAVTGLRTLDVTDVRRLRPLLDDPAPGVVREVTAALLPSADVLDEAELMERLGDHWPRAMRLAAFRLLDARGGIVRLRAGVELLDDPDERLRARAAQSVRGWHPTTAGGDAEVARLLERAAGLFTERELGRLRWEAGIRP